MSSSAHENEFEAPPAAIEENDHVNNVECLLVIVRHVLQPVGDVATSGYGCGMFSSPPPGTWNSMRGMITGYRGGGAATARR